MSKLKLWRKDGQVDTNDELLHGDVLGWDEENMKKRVVSLCL